MKTENEKIKKYFNDRAGDYEVHHLSNIDGGIRGKKIVAKYVPKSAKTILDLGAGTGLELRFILDKVPRAHIVCVDFSDKMLKQLLANYKGYDVAVVCKDYFKYEYTENMFDCVVSVMSFHHFPKEQKTILYSKILRTLKPGGVFINCDYMVHSKEEEAACLEEYENKKRATDKEFIEFGFDIPCAVETEKDILKSVGFADVLVPWKYENSVLIMGTKK